MGQFYDTIPPELVPWLLRQELFWVATAALSASAHVNVSPKGVRDSFHVAAPARVWYQDLSGSGAETVAHLRENGRVTLMFSAFEGPPRIVRLFGTGASPSFAFAFLRWARARTRTLTGARTAQGPCTSSARPSTTRSSRPRSVAPARAPRSSSTCTKSAPCVVSLPRTPSRATLTPSPLPLFFYLR